MNFSKLVLLAIMLQSAAFGAVIIHEVAPGCNGVSTAEFVELYNTGAGPVNLTGWNLVFRGRTSSSDSGTLTLSGTIPAGGYFLITGRDYASLIGLAINGNTLGIVYPIGDLHDTGVVVGKLSAAAGQLGLKDPSGTLMDAAAYGIDPAYTGVYVETLSKSTGTGFSSRRSVSRNTTHSDTGNNSIDFIYPPSDDIPAR